jgi:multiple sugar transport system substrate-binding protein
MSKLKMSRRNFLEMAALTSTGAILAACGGPQATPESVPTQAPVANTPVPAATQAPVENTPLPVPTEAPPAKAPVTIKWWDFPREWAGNGSATNPNAWNEDAGKQYAAENPGITVENTSISWSDGPQKLDVALAADQGPDVLYAYPALFGKMLSLNVLADITPYASVMPDYDDFYDTGWNFVTIQGKKYAFPWYFGTESEWAINTTIVKEAGAEDLLPKGPEYSWTPEQMVEFYKKCTFKRANGDQVWGTVCAANEQQGINLWPLTSYVFTYGTDLYEESEGKSHFGDEPGVKAFQMMYDLVNKYKVAPPGAAGLSDADAKELWNRKQDTILTNSGVEVMVGLQKALDAGTIQAPFEVLPVLQPFEAGVKKQVAAGIWVLMNFVQKESSKLDEVVKFTEWILNPTNMMIFGNLSKICARKSTTEKLSAGDEVTQWRIKYVLPYSKTYSKHPADFQVWDAVMQAIQSMYDDKQTPAEAAKSFEEAANKLLQGA